MPRHSRESGVFGRRMSVHTVTWLSPRKDQTLSPCRVSSSGSVIPALAGSFGRRMSVHPWTLLFAREDQTLSRSRASSSSPVIPALAGSFGRRMSVHPWTLLFARKDQTLSRCRASSFLLERLERNEPKKTPFPDTAHPRSVGISEFSDSPLPATPSKTGPRQRRGRSPVREPMVRQPPRLTHGSVRKRRTSLSAALRVTGCCAWLTRYAKPKAKSQKPKHNTEAQSW